MSQLPSQHEDRLALALELHARPFPQVEAPGEAVHLAIKPRGDAADVDPETARKHLRDLLDRHGAPHPAPGADHHICQLGRGMLKWERHTEFATYTLFLPGLPETPFDTGAMRAFPADWLAHSPGTIVSAVLARIESVDSAEAADARLGGPLQRHFAREELAASRVLDGQATVASDFRIDETGFTRMAVLVEAGAGSRRLGRLVQRLLEIETYRAMSMLALPISRMVIRRASELDRELAELARGVAEEADTAPTTLDSLTRRSAEVERMGADSAFRFGAGRAYEAIVQERITALREVRLRERQTIGEFMQRRYDPAMRTSRAAERRLEQISQRAARIADLLRTRVDVSINVQNKALLESMNRRADLQLRLQRTVEGLSVVAISYYAVGLAGYVLKPLTKTVDLSQEQLMAIATPMVVLLAWYLLRRVRREAEAGRP